MLLLGSTTATLQTTFFWRVAVSTIIALGMSSNGCAQNVEAFLRDVIRGSPRAREQLEHRIYHLQIAREVAFRTLLLEKCVGFQDAPNDPRFEEYSEKLLTSLGSFDPSALTVFTAGSQIQEAAIRSELTEGQIQIIDRIMISPRYGDFVEYLSFERAELEIAAGFSNVNTGAKEPWIAAAALSFLRQSQYFPLLVAHIGKADSSLLGERLLDALRPDQAHAQDAYFASLIGFFSSQLASRSLRQQLPVETRFLLTLHDSLGLDAMRGAASMASNLPPDARMECKAKNSAACVSETWLTEAINLKNRAEATQYETAAGVLRNQFGDLCGHAKR